ncbi:MAG TPA: Ig-like domain-containing protein [Polyangiaceae bacterium]|nr:Ig-like domain-containing protein [Polyangiaceae bacterium]
MLATYPADGQGTNSAADAGVACDTPTPDCAVPTDAAIELRFDRFLLPGSQLATALRLFTGGPTTGDPNANAVAVSAQYDVVERVVVLRPAALQPNTLYTAVITPSTDPAQGFWAFDLAPLEAGDVPLSFSFTTGNGPAAPSTLVAASDNCQSITQPSVSAGMGELPAGPLNTCSTATCHENPDSSTASYPPMGLSLTDWGLFYTAINHVAHQTETGESALGPGFLSSPRFGVQMNLVTPGAPESSYLMYKLLRKPSNYALDSGEPCQTALHPPVADGACFVPTNDDAELARLREWFVLGDPMPKDKDTPAPFSRDGLVRVAAWISAGATCSLSP